MDKEILEYGYKSVESILPVFEVQRKQIFYMQSDDEGGTASSTHPIAGAVSPPKKRSSGIKSIDKKVLSQISYYSPVYLPVIHLNTYKLAFITAATTPNAQVFFNGQQIDKTSSTALEKCLFTLAGEFEHKAIKSHENIAASFEIDLTDKKIRGRHAIYRFVRFLEGSSYIILIEELKLPASVGTQKLPADNKVVFEEDSFDIVGGYWDDDKFTKLHQALSLLTPKERQLIRGAKFEISSQASSQEGGHYSFKSNTISIQNNIFSLDSQTDQFGKFSYAVFIILHEIGHAIDFYPFNTPLGRKDSYTKEEEKELRKLKTLTGYFFDKKLNFVADSSKNDSKYPFRKAFSNSRRTTKYGETNWQENFAESFAVFKVDFESFKFLRPEATSFFQNL